MWVLQVTRKLGRDGCGYLNLSLQVMWIEVLSEKNESIRRLAEGTGGRVDPRTQLY